MLTLKTLRENPEHVIEKLAVKHFDAREIVEKVIALDDNRKALQTESPDLRPILKKAGFVKRDPREKERKKYGLRSARKKEQFSKR